MLSYFTKIDFKDLIVILTYPDNLKIIFIPYKVIMRLILRTKLLF